MGETKHFHTSRINYEERKGENPREEEMMGGMQWLLRLCGHPVGWALEVEVYSSEMLQQF